MTNPLTIIFTFLRNLFHTLFTLLSELFSSHPCTSCNCTIYNEEAFFESLRRKSHLSTYVDDIVSLDVLHKPLHCSTCNHLRSLHGLSDRVLTPDMLPNGGLVHSELIQRERQSRRRQRFGDLNTTPIQDAAQMVGKTDLVEGNGRVVQNGDEVVCYYKAFVAKSMELFEECRSGKGISFVVGEGNVIKGWEIGVVGMKVGGRRKLYVPAELAYGGKMIAGERFVDIAFEVELRAVVSS